MNFLQLIFICTNVCLDLVHKTIPVNLSCMCISVFKRWMCACKCNVKYVRNVKSTIGLLTGDFVLWQYPTRHTELTRETGY